MIIEQWIPYLVAGLAWIPSIYLIGWALWEMETNYHIQENWLYFVSISAFVFLFVVSHC